MCFSFMTKETRLTGMTHREEAQIQVVHQLSIFEQLDEITMHCLLIYLLFATFLSQG